MYKGPYMKKHMVILIVLYLCIAGVSAGRGNPKKEGVKIIKPGAQPEGKKKQMKGLANAAEEEEITAEDHEDLEEKKKDLARMKKDAAKNRKKVAAAPIKDIAYGPHERQWYDFHAPVNPGGEPTAVIIHFHGAGGIGTKRNGKPVYTEAGIAVVDAEFRTCRDARADGVKPWIKGVLMDCARVVQHVRYNAAEYNIDPDRIAIRGGSAGGNKGLWVALHDDMADPESNDPVSRMSTRVCAVGITKGQVTYDPVLLQKMHLPYCKTDKDRDSIPAKGGYGAFGFWGGKPYGPDNEEPDRIKFDQAIVDEYSAVFHISKDDPPIMTAYTRWNGEIPETGEGLNGSIAKLRAHHPAQGKYLYDRAKEAGAECHMLCAGYAKSTTGEGEKLLYTMRDDFFFDKLKKEAESPNCRDKQKGK